jgi:hypothetical protein
MKTLLPIALVTWQSTERLHTGRGDVLYMRCPEDTGKGCSSPSVAPTQLEPAISAPANETTWRQIDEEPSKDRY